MKAAKIIGLFNVALAFAFVVAAVAIYRHRFPVPRTVAMPQHEIRVQSQARQAKVAVKSAPDRSDLPRAYRKNDYPAVIQYLRGLGCPEETIHEIVHLAVTRRYHETLMQTMREKIGSTPWYRSHANDVQTFYEESKKVRQPMADELHALLGVTENQLLLEEMGLSGPSSQTPDPGANKIEVVTRKHIDKIEEFQKRPTVASGQLSETDKAELAKLRADFQTELKQSLPPAEFADYEVHHSLLSQFLRNYMPQARSEEEFMAMVRAARATGIDFSQFFAGFIVPAEFIDVNARREQAKAAILAQLKNQLPPDQADDLTQKVQADQAATAQAEQKTRQEVENDHRNALIDQIVAVDNPTPISRAAAEQFVKEYHALLTEAQQFYAGKTVDEEKVLQEMRTRCEKLAIERLGPNGADIFKKVFE